MTELTTTKLTLRNGGVVYVDGSPEVIRRRIEKRAAAGDRFYPVPYKQPRNYIAINEISTIWQKPESNNLFIFPFWFWASAHIFLFALVVLTALGIIPGQW